MIILLYGPDTFRSRQKLRELKNKFTNEIDKSGLNLTELDGKKLDVSKFENDIATPPFLAKKRMVVIENLITSNKGKKIQAEVLKILEKNKFEESILIFWEEDGEADKKSTLLKRLKKEKYNQQFKILTPLETKKWADKEIKDRGGKINIKALESLVDFVGNDLWQMNSEIEKLLAYKRGEEIRVEDISELVMTKIDDDIFKLTDAIGHKNKVLAIKLISDQFKNGVSPTRLLSKIIWQFKNLLVIKSGVEDNGLNTNQLTIQTKLHPFVVKKTLAQIKNYSLEDLKKTYNQLLNIDHKIKTSRVDPEVLFDLLIVKS